MRLSNKEIELIDWNDFSIQEIECLIDLGCVTNDDIVWYYGNKQWSDDMEDSAVEMGYYYT